MGLRVIMVGDLVGKPGRRVLQQQLPRLREEYAPDLVVVNAENVAGGSGLTPQLFQRILNYGVDGVTLGDHVYRRQEIIPVLREAENLVRPANLPESAVGARWMELRPAAGAPTLCVMTLLGRLYMNGGPLADDPFAEAERFLAEIPSGAASLIELHGETTSEKLALGHYLDGRASAVVGTHTHVPTADAKVMPGGTAFITDLGMTGPYDSVIGRRKGRVMQFMSTGMPAPFDVAEEDVRLCGVFFELGDNGLAARCERVEMKADPDRPPFVDANS